MLVTTELETIVGIIMPLEIRNPGSIFCIFTSIACILIGKDEEYENKRENACEHFGLSVQ